MEKIPLPSLRTSNHAFLSWLDCFSTMIPKFWLIHVGRCLTFPMVQMKKSKLLLVSVRYHLFLCSNFASYESDAGVCRRLVELLMHLNQSVVSAALRAVGNIVTGDDSQTQIILNCNVLPCLLHLLSSTKESIRKEACWTISNITAGNRGQIDAVVR